MGNLVQKSWWHGTVRERLRYHPCSFSCSFWLLHGRSAASDDFGAWSASRRHSWECCRSSMLRFHAVHSESSLVNLSSFTVNSCCGMLGACYIACINNTVPASQRAFVNGLCVTFESLGKGLGPLGTAIA